MKISKAIRQSAGTSSWKAWLNKDISLKGISKGKKLKINQQLKVIQLFKQLLKAGFTLTEIVAFLVAKSLVKRIVLVSYENEFNARR